MISDSVGTSIHEHLSTDSFTGSWLDESSINPTTGLAMISSLGGVDIGGNPYGTDLHVSDNNLTPDHFDQDDWSSGSSFDDRW